MLMLVDHAWNPATQPMAASWILAMSDEHTRELLQRWHSGDRAAIEVLIARDLPWIAKFVKARIGPLLRGRGETQDYVQDAMLRVLAYVPRFVTGNRSGFRALLARMIENHLRDAHDHHAALRRSPLRECSVPSDSVLDLDRPERSVTQPGSKAERNEQASWVRLAIELLDQEDRQVLLLREWQGMEFAAIGAELGISHAAARMRFQRALPKLAMQLERIRSDRGVFGGGPEPDSANGWPA
jgi:RNA polymerase sigma-70 factor, ECF subfamily